MKCVAAIAALVPIHATEEWIFPGGFAYQYNLFLNKSDFPNAYPMNRASDMITVLGTTILYALLVLYFILLSPENQSSAVFCWEQPALAR